MRKISFTLTEKQYNYIIKEYRDGHPISGNRESELDIIVHEFACAGEDGNPLFSLAMDIKVEKI